MTLDPAIVAEIVGLLTADDLSHRAIGRATGASRGTVDNLANGKRAGVPAPTISEVFVAGPVANCPGCGARVRISPKTGDCIACQVRQRGGKATKPRDAESTALKLEPGDLERYEAIRTAARQRWLGGIVH